MNDSTFSYVEVNLAENVSHEAKFALLCQPKLEAYCLKLKVPVRQVKINQQLVNYI